MVNETLRAKGGPARTNVVYYDYYFIGVVVKTETVEVSHVEVNLLAFDIEKCKSIKINSSKVYYFNPDDRNDT